MIPDGRLPFPKPIAPAISPVAFHLFAPAPFQFAPTTRRKLIWIRMRDITVRTKIRHLYPAPNPAGPAKEYYRDFSLNKTTFLLSLIHI